MESVIIEKRKKVFSADGNVMGYAHKRLWAPFLKITGETREDIISQVKNGLKNNSLEAVVHFKNLITAHVNIHTYETLTINGKEYLGKSTEFIEIHND